MAFLSSEWGLLMYLYFSALSPSFSLYRKEGCKKGVGREQDTKTLSHSHQAGFKISTQWEEKTKEWTKIKRGWGLFITTGLLVWKKGDSMIFFSFEDSDFFILKHFRFQPFSRQNLNINMTWATGKKMNLNSLLREEGEWGAERTLSD